MLGESLGETREMVYAASASFAAAAAAVHDVRTRRIPNLLTGGSPITVSDPLNILLFSSKLNAGVTIKDLEQKQILQILAEPTLTTLSGIAARFLSGGEFPLPVVQGGTGNSTAITIVWKPYGVKVDFTPTANSDGTIRLKIAPEVSTLDYTNAVTISGFTVPALSTRRAETEVELQSGQSFVLSGLLDHRTTDNLSRMPGIANVPILGQLFRSKGMTLTTVDLAVVVTVNVVNPLAHPETIVEPKMIVPNLDKQRFDNDVTHKKSSKGIDLIVQVSRMSDGTRRITHITEVTGTSGEIISLQDIFLFEKQGLGVNGKVNGRFFATGIVPKFAETLAAAGVPLSLNLMDHSVEV